MYVAKLKCSLAIVLVTSGVTSPAQSLVSLAKLEGCAPTIGAYSGDDIDSDGDEAPRAAEDATAVELGEAAEEVKAESAPALASIGFIRCQSP